jgi:signal transduction histidine kinase
LWLAGRATLHYFKFPQKQIVKNLLTDHEIRAMTSINNNQQLIATEFGGWFLFNPLKEQIKPYSLYENGKQINLHASRNFFQIDKTLWSNDASGGIVAVDTLTHQIEYFRHYPVICMVKPTDSTLVYGTKKYHLMEFDLREKVHKSILPTDSLDIYDLEWQAKDHIIIAATDKGLLTYDLSTQEHRFFNHPNQLKDSFLLMADYHPDYGYILGSRTGIVTSFNLETQQFKILYEDELKAGIATVLFDDQDNWWINTFNGIVSFHPETGKTVRYSDKDGFSNNETNRYSALKTPHGFLVGTIQGLNFFKPGDLNKQTSKGELRLMWLYAYDKKKKNFSTNFNRTQLSENKPIILPPENRTLEVYFSLSELDLNRNERYRYRLNNKEWVDLGSKRSVRFPNMAVGDHLMEIEALDFSGNKMGASLFLNIHSKNFFYKTGWFYFCITLLFMGSALWVIRQQWLRKKLQEEFARGLIESAEEERSRIAKELHDGVGQQLSFIKRQLMEQQHTMSSVASNTLEEVRNISRGLYPAIIQQLGLTGSIEQLFFDLDKQTDFFVSTVIDEVDDSFDEKAALHIYRFIQETISNILKHAFPLSYNTTSKTVSVDILKGERAVTIIIQDNGKGFDPIKKQKKNSLGLKTIEERIRILEGTLTIDSHQRVGTTLTAKIPHTHAKKS